MTLPNRSNPTIEIAKNAMEMEARSIVEASNRLNGEFKKAIEILLAHTGKIMITGMGKSGHIAQKIAATFSSTGTPAIFLHPSDALHGDLGVYSPGDPTILISKSGVTVELMRLIPMLREFNSPLIGILGNLNSSLAQNVDVILDARVGHEADPLDLAPTSSTAVAMALGDALAVVLMKERNFKVEDFARFHPGGQLGRNLWLHVSDIMHPLDKVAFVKKSDSLKDVVISMTNHPLGAAVVLDDKDSLLGIITDGDVRRALQKYDDIRSLTAQQVMISKPVVITPEDSLSEAADCMEKRSSQISVLPVIDRKGRCLGLIRIHDIYQANI